MKARILIVAVLLSVVAWVTTAPTALGLDAGTYQVGSDIQPGIYAGMAGTDILDSCHWQRLSGLSGELDDTIASEIARGQFYVDVKSTDKYFRVGCEITPLAEWPVPPQPLSTVGTGMYMVGRDIAPSIYAGRAGTDILDSCHWERLRGASGEFHDTIASEIARGQFYVDVKATDGYFSVRCEVTTLENWPVPPQPLSTVGTGMYMVGRDIAPSIYAGRAGTDILDSCHWERLRGASGEFHDTIASEIARGQFYVDVKATDSYFSVRCEVTTLENWPVPPQPLSTVGTGMYMVGRDIAPSIYAGRAGTDILDSCHWERLRGASGEFHDNIASEIARGQFYVDVKATDSYFSVRCEVTTLENWPVPPQPLSTIGPGMYLVDRDIQPGIYVGMAGTGILNSCHWQRLSGVSGESHDSIASGSETGLYHISVDASDFALMTRCDLILDDTSGADHPVVSLTITSTPLVRLNTPIAVTESFSKPVSGFTESDITVDNGFAGNFVGSDGDSVYSFDVTPDAVGAVTVEIDAQVTEDAAGNGNLAAPQLILGIPYDDDGDGAISRNEVITAIGDYLFSDLLTRDEVIEIITLYLFG